MFAEKERILLYKDYFIKIKNYRPNMRFEEKR